MSLEPKNTQKTKLLCVLKITAWFREKFKNRSRATAEQVSCSQLQLRADDDNQLPKK
jgi:hypothetical protein